MKFLHTADGQLGMKAAQVGVAGEKVRAQRLKIAERIIHLAREQAADFILYGGYSPKRAKRLKGELCL